MTQNLVSYLQRTKNETQILERNCKCVLWYGKCL